MDRRAELLERIAQEWPLVRRQIAEIEAELAKDRPQMTHEGKVVLEGTVARTLLQTFLGALQLVEEVYRMTIRQVAN